MLGVLLTAIGTFLQEVSLTIGKRKVRAHEESRYTMGFLDYASVLAIFAVITIIRPSAFVFSFASLPTFGARVVLELLQLHYTLIAITVADRSTFSFVRVGTIPLLLAGDVLFGYAIQPLQIAGIALVVLAFGIAAVTHGVRKAGMGPLLFTTVNAALTISLFKYNITHYNSVVAEQMLVNLVALAYCAVFARRYAHEHPFAFLWRPVFLRQSLANGMGSILESFAYALAPASVILAAKRAFALLWSVGSGNVVFHERHPVLKFSLATCFGVGVVLLILR